MPERRAAKRADAARGKARVPRPNRAGATGRTVQPAKAKNQKGRQVSRSRMTDSPPSNFERGAADADIAITRDAPAESDPYERGQIGGGPGAGDSSSGGGAGAGIPDPDTVLRTDRIPGRRGNLERDKAKLFPQAAKRQPKAKSQPPPTGM